MAYICMSTINGTMDREKLKEFIKNTNKPIQFTYGFKSKSPTTLNKPISKEAALRMAETLSPLDAYESKEVLDLQTYSANDMW